VIELMLVEDIDADGESRRDRGALGEIEVGLAAVRRERHDAAAIEGGTLVGALDRRV
jgi:hypothetical protein